MDQNNAYLLPPLPYGYKDLEPFMSEEQLTLHHQKHHQAYVTNANKLIEKLNQARSDNSEIDIKGVLKELSFNLGGHILHTLYWANMRPKGQGSEAPQGNLLNLINLSFHSFERFKKEFAQTAVSVEGSGWAALVWDELANDLRLMQIEKHNNLIYPGLKVLLVLDVWEHAYYVDYRNDRAKFVETFWSIVNWEEVERRLANLTK